MLQERLLSIILFVTVAVFGNAGPIGQRDIEYDITNDTEKAQDHLTDESFKSRTMKVERLWKNAKNGDNCVGSCTDQNLKSLNNSNQLNESCPYENVTLCLIFHLSKLADIKVANSDGTFPVNHTSKPIGQLNEIEEKRFVYEEYAKDGNNPNVSKDHMKPANNRCLAFGSVYIPEVKRNLPALTCKFGNNTFILSSTRFLQDRRLDLDISVDESILKNVKSVSKVARSNRFNVIPGLLVLNAATKNYRIEARKERKVNRMRRRR